MWTYLKKDDANDYFTKYSSLSDIIEEIVLYETEDAIFLPRLFSENYPHKSLQIFKGKTEFIPNDIGGMEFVGELRKEQKPIVDYIVNTYNQNKQVNGIVKAPPGLG